jgi:hypothetical protein
MALCILVLFGSCYISLRGKRMMSSALKTEATGSSVMFYFSQTRRCHLSEHSNLHTHRDENVKSQITFQCLIELIWILLYKEYANGIN